MITSDILQANAAGIDIRHKLDNKNTMLSMHLHNCYEIYFSRSSGNRFFVGNKIYNVELNDVFLFAPSDLHKISLSPRLNVYDRYVCLFSDEALTGLPASDYKELMQGFSKRGASHSHRIPLSPDAAAHFLALLDKAIDKSPDSPFYTIALRLSLQEILLFLATEIDRTRASSTIVTPHSKTSTVELVIEYITKHFGEPLTLDILAKESFLNKHYLCRLFKAETGFGINDFIHSVRLSHAVTMLKNGKTVSETAEACGYSCDTYFISIFTRSMGISPKQYSLRSRNNGK